MGNKLLFVLVMLMSWACNASDEHSPVTLIFAADMPNISDERTGRYAELKTLVDEYRNTSDSVFFVFGGGSIGPSALSSFDRGSHIIDLLNSLEPDVMGVTKREFSFYEDELSLRSYEAAFPIVTSNVKDSRVGQAPEGLLSSALIRKENVSLGVISILHERVISEYQLFDVVVEPPQKAVLEASQVLKERGADIVLLNYSYPFPFVSNFLEKGIVDIAFISDSRLNDRPYDDSIDHPNILKLATPATAIVATINKKSQWAVSSVDYTALADIQPHPMVKKQLLGYESRLKRLLNIQIGEWQTAFSTERKLVRGAENAFVNFVVDTIREHAGADIGLVNGGSIRGNDSYGVSEPITRQDIVSELPFRAHVVTLILTGEQIVQALEEGLSQYENSRGGFPHVSGMAYTFDSNAKPFGRIQQVTVNGKPLVNEKYYTLATSDFIANGGDGYESLSSARRKENASARPPQISDLVVQAIVDKFEVKLTLEERIRNLAEGGD